MKAHDFIRSQKNDVLQVGVCGGVRMCAHMKWESRGHWGSSPKEAGKGEQENFEREEGRKEEMEASLQLSVIDSLEIWLL